LLITLSNYYNKTSVDVITIDDDDEVLEPAKNQKASMVKKEPVTKKKRNYEEEPVDTNQVFISPNH